MRFTISSIDPTLILDEYGNEAFRYLGIHPQDVEDMLYTRVNLRDAIDDHLETIKELEEEVKELEEEISDLEDELHGAEYDYWELEKLMESEVSRLTAEVDNLNAQRIAR